MTHEEAKALGATHHKGNHYYKFSNGYWFFLNFGGKWSLTFRDISSFAKPL